MAVQARARVHNTIGAPPPARPHEQARRRADHLQLHLAERLDARTAIIGHWVSHRAWGEAARACWRYREYGAIAIAIWAAFVPWLWWNSFPPGYTIRAAVVAAIVGWPFAWYAGDGTQARAVAREQRFLDTRIKPTPRVSRVDELHHGGIHHATEIKGRIADGLQPEDVERQQPTLEVIYGGTTEVRVAPTGTFTIRRTHHDLLAKRPLWTPSDAPGSTLTLGVDRDGLETVWSLSEARMLIAGMSGAGKSITLNAQIAQLAGRDLDLYLIDPHRTDFKPWYPHATHVARDIGSAITLLAQVADAHQAELDRNDTDDLDMADGVKRVLVIDELAFLTHKARPHAKHVLEHLERLATGGRKSGTAILAATQYPETDVIPSIIRGQFNHRIGMRCEYDAATDVVFGTNARPQGIHLARIPANQPGRGHLFTGGHFTELRCYGLQGDAKWKAAKAIPVRSKPASDQPVAPTEEQLQTATAIPLPPAPPTEKQTKTDQSTIITPAALREHCIEALDLAGPFGVSNPALAEKLDVPPMRVYRQMAALRKLGLARTDGTRWYREAS